ncbi:hypothetical protein TWF696_002410 [Orbilia brochopaga]|uniref:Uncharacterized protein n=1 Tax=Orbilia brochopaga TaxID=3140254 RepID=A0AAV9U6Q8_9PEZI
MFHHTIQFPPDDSDAEDAPPSVIEANQPSTNQTPTKKRRGQSASGDKGKSATDPAGQRRSKRLKAATGGGDRAQDSFGDNQHGVLPEEDLDRLRELGQAVERNLPPGYFDESPAAKPPLRAWQQAIVEVSRYYPGCENTELLKRKYTKEHPEVRAVTNAEDVWNRGGDTGEDSDGSA